MHLFRIQRSAFCPIPQSSSKRAFHFDRTSLRTINMTSHSLDIAKLESLANTLAQGLETLLAEIQSRQNDESKRLAKYKCLAAQVRAS
jgi:hypothetical protein